MKKSFVITCIAIGTTALVAGCAAPHYNGAPSYPAVSQPVPQPYPATYPPAPSYFYGTIDSIRVSQSTGTGSGAGAVVGGLVGGLLGNQVGGGQGRTAATIAGVIGGAMVGDQIEQRNAQPRDAYQIGVRLDNGGYRTVTQDSISGLQAGSRVRVENGHVYRY